MSRQAPIIRQAVTPVVNGDSSPLTAANDASSIRANPSVVSPDAILSAPRFDCAYAFRSGVGRAVADLDRAFGLGEGRLDVAGRAGGLAPHEGEVSVDVRVALAADDPLRAAGPARGDRVLAGEAVRPREVDREVRRTLLIAGLLVRLEGALLERELLTAPGDEERRQRQRLEVRAGERAVAVRLRQLVERLLPGMAAQGIPPGLDGIDDRGHDLTHGGHCATGAVRYS